MYADCQLFKAQCYICAMAGKGAWPLLPVISLKVKVNSMGMEYK